MLAEKIKNNKTVFLTVLLIIAASLIMGGSIVMAQGNSENAIATKSENEAVVRVNEDNGSVTVDDGVTVEGSDGSDVQVVKGTSLYKSSGVVPEKIAKKVCEKYGYDFDSVTLDELCVEATNYEAALMLLDEQGEMPILSNGKDKDSLETYILDNNNQPFTDIIKNVCKESGVDAKNGKVKDLTVDQLTEIFAQMFKKI